MTPEDILDFANPERCLICNKHFPTEYSNKVLLTGRYRGAAQNSCYVNYKFTFKVPVLIHNNPSCFPWVLQSFDFFATAAFSTTKLHLIGQEYEKYLTLSFGPHIVFKDCYQFLACYLEQLVNNLLKAVGLTKFPILLMEISRYSDAQRQLLVRKGVYRYVYMGKLERVQERMLSPIEKIFNSLKQELCSPEDFAHARQVWQQFH